MIGDFFCLLRPDGFYWTGTGWAWRWQQARRFAGPVDPSADADRLADKLRRGLGVRVNVAYVPCSKVAIS